MYCPLLRDPNEVAIVRYQDTAFENREIELSLIGGAHQAGLDGCRTINLSSPQAGGDCSVQVLIEMKSKH